MSNGQNPNLVLNTEGEETSSNAEGTPSGENEEVFLAEVAESDVAVAKPFAQAYFEPPPIPNVAAIGGAVASFLLGALSIIGSLISPFSIINGVLAILFGLWGLKSPRKRLAFIGIFLGIIGGVMNIGRILLDLTVLLERMTPTP